MPSPAQRRDTRCRHFNGVQNKVCESKVEYPACTIPCFGEGNLECEGYYPLSSEELAARDAADTRRYCLWKQGLSDCCEAPIDMKFVAAKGAFKGHGPRYCSKCRNLLFMV